jgi:hypothetical protein
MAPRGRAEHRFAAPVGTLPRVWGFLAGTGGFRTSWARQGAAATGSSGQLSAMDRRLGCFGGSLGPDLGARVGTL